MGDVIRFPDPTHQTWEPWLDEAMIARHYNVSERTVRRWRQQGAPSRRLGGSRRYRITELDAWHQHREAS